MDKPMDVLRANIRHLKGGRSVNALAADAGVPQSWLQRLLNPDKAGGTQSRTSTEHLEKLARHLGVTTAQLMFQNLTKATPPPSQLTGQEEEIVHAAVKLLGYLDELAPTPPPPEAYASRLFLAMQVAREEGADGILDGSSLVDASKQLAARLRAMG